MQLTLELSAVSSAVVPEALAQTGASLTAVTVIETVAVLLSRLPSVAW